MRTYTRPYVGLKAGKMTVFRSDVTPTEENFGKEYNLVVGPFRTIRAARFMASCGVNNPHCQTVCQAERLSLKEERPNTCKWQTATGMPWTKVCGKPSQSDWCPEHIKDHTEQYPHLPALQ